MPIAAWNSVFDGNRSGSGTFTFSANCSFDTTFTGFSTGNVSSDGQCRFPPAGNRVNTAARLGPLVSFGGTRWGMAPLPGSPLLDAAVDSECPEFDARSVHRPQGPHCDIGAVEIVPGAPLPTPTPSPTPRPRTPVSTISPGPFPPTPTPVES
jgi:hypothetical protein